MAHVVFERVSLRYPIYNARQQSLRNHIVRLATGGLISSEAGRAPYVTALEDVSFELKDGDSVGLIGYNGAGKSSLLRMLAGIYTPSLGRVRIQGLTATIFEIGAGLEPELSGYQNIINLAMMLGMTLEQAKKIIPDVEEFTELGSFLHLPVRTYSSGMTMRLMFAVATSRTPEIPLIDEMFSTGDEGFRKKLGSSIPYDRKFKHFRFCFSRPQSGVSMLQQGVGTRTWACQRS